MARRAETVGWSTVAAAADPSLFPARHRLRRNFTGDRAGQCWNLLSGPRDLIATEYGRLLALKLGLFAAMIGFAAVNRFHLTPQLPRPTALRALERNSLAEIALGLGVLLFVAALGTMEPPVHDHVHLPTGPIDPQAAYVHIHSETAMADVSITPGRAGPARATILLLQEDFTPFTAKDVDASAHAAGTARRCIDIEQRHSPARRKLDRRPIGDRGSGNLGRQTHRHARDWRRRSCSMRRS